MMKYSVSNIAWLPSEDKEVAKHLKNSFISGIEIAPSRYFSNVENASNQDFDALRNYWIKFGFPITSLQSLLFQRPDLQLFGNNLTRQKLANYILNLGMKAAILGAGPMVFGSPKNRDIGNIKLEYAKILACEFFQDLGSKWTDNTSYLVFEANPEIYECNFITRTSEAIKLVESVNSEKFRWHLDLACTEAGNESSVELLLATPTLPSHIHISERNLSPLNISNSELYKNVIETLLIRNYQGVITLEMRRTGSMRDLLDSIKILGDVAR